MRTVPKRLKSPMPRVERIKGLERGLKVLQVLQSQPIVSLHDIFVATAISKPSLLRILTTLEAAGLVSRRLADGHYRLSTLTGVMRERDRHDRVAEAAASVMVRLCEKVKWQCDLHVPAGNHMERRESTRAFSPLAAHKFGWIRNPVRFPAPWLVAAVGRAYLACCSEREREQILRRLRKSNEPVDRLARDPKRLDTILNEVRRRGYATRDPSFVGGIYGSPAYDDGLAAIAVALSGRTRVYGSINLLWVKTAFAVEEFAARHLADLQQAAREIVSSLEPTKS
jgi:IclR family transcriptional regulator, mhp operon transcriptional activator